MSDEREAARTYLRTAILNALRAGCTLTEIEVLAASVVVERSEYLARQRALPHNSDKE